MEHNPSVHNVLVASAARVKFHPFIIGSSSIQLVAFLTLNALRSWSAFSVSTHAESWPRRLTQRLLSEGLAVLKWGKLLQEQSVSPFVSFLRIGPKTVLGKVVSHRKLSNVERANRSRFSHRYGPSLRSSDMSSCAPRCVGTTSARTSGGNCRSHSDALDK